MGGAVQGAGADLKHIRSDALPDRIVVVQKGAASSVPVLPVASGRTADTLLTPHHPRGS